MTRITGRSRSPVPTDPAVSYADVPAGGWPRGWRMNRLLQSTFPPVLLSWLSSRFVNDQSLRRVGLLAWDDVTAWPWPQSASVRIRHDQARSDPARRHAAFDMVPAPEPARGMDRDPGRNSTSSPCWRCRSANSLATGLASYGARRAHLGVLPLREAPSDRRYL